MSDKLSSRPLPKTYQAPRRSSLTRHSSGDVSGGARVHTQPTKIKAMRAPSEPDSPIISSDHSDFPLTQATAVSTPDPDPPIGLSFLSDPLSQIIPMVATSSSLISMTTATITTTCIGAPISSIVGVPVSVTQNTAPPISVPMTFSVAVSANTYAGLQSSDLSVSIPEHMSAHMPHLSDTNYSLAVSTPLPDDQVEVSLRSTGSHTVDLTSALPVLADGPPASNYTSVQEDPDMIVEDIHLSQKRKTDHTSPTWADDWDSSSEGTSLADSHRPLAVSFPKLVQSPQPKRVRPIRKKRGSVSSVVQGQRGTVDRTDSEIPPTITSSVKPHQPITQVKPTIPIINYGPSTSAGTSATKVPRTSPTVTNQQSKTSTKLSNVPTLVVTSRKDRLPPIVCSGGLSPTALKDLKQITPLFEAEFEARHTNSRAIFYMRTPKDHKQMVSFLLNNGVPLHSWTLPEDRNARLVIRGLNVDTPLSHIEDALHEHDIQFSNISRMRSRGQDPVEWPLFLVTLQGTSQLQTALKITHLGRIRVTVEIFRGNLSVTQCYRCQEFGHTSHNCHERAICVKCAGDHRSSECQKPESEPLTCCHCRGPHTANYTLCPSRSKWLANRENNRASQQSTSVPTPKPAQPVSAVSTSAARVAGVSYAERVSHGRSSHPSAPTTTPRDGPPDESLASTVRDILDFLKKINICNWLKGIKDLLHSLSTARSGFEFCELLIPSLISLFASSPSEGTGEVVNA